jgi:hypothetical protein
VQFHPEVTPEVVAAWLAAGGAEQAAARGIAPARLQRDAERERGAAARRAGALVDAFLSRAFGSAPG